MRAAVNPVKETAFESVLAELERLRGELVEILNHNDLRYHRGLRSECERLIKEGDRLVLSLTETGPATGEEQ